MKKIKVAVVMGSESDMPVMAKACSTLKGLGIEFEMAVASAHRTPRHLRKVIDKCEAAGVEVYIAGAGMAAHLPGVIASMTLKPVIGVPLSSRLLGLDSLLSIVQMPKGIPVATVAIDGSENAALLAAQIISLGDKRLVSKLAQQRENYESESGKNKHG
jgi:5-(carboxyamino)imidazole ribonucleotide mutase